MQAEHFIVAGFLSRLDEFCQFSPESNSSAGVDCLRI